MTTELIFTLVIVLGIATLIDKIYAKVQIDNYSPLWEYFCKALLYGVISIFTLYYGKETFSDVSPLEWAIIAVSIIEGTGNYINYVKESKKRKGGKGMKILKISPHIYKVEAWLFMKVSAWIVTVDDGVYIIDTGMSFMGKRILNEAEKLGTLKGILLTHGHSDHVGGLKKILEIKKVPVFAHEADIPYMEGKEPFPGRKKVEFLVKPGLVQPLKMTNGNLDNMAALIPIHTPGHSPGHVVYYHKEDRVLIGGDLFTSKNGQLQKPMAMFTSDMEEAIKSGRRVIEEMKPDIVSICHGNDVKEPHKQIENYLVN